MNIKGFGVNLPTQVDLKKTSDTQDKMRMEQSADRDADGRRQDGGNEEGAPTEEQILKAIEHLKEHSGVKDNGLSVLRKETNGKTVLVLQDHLGKVVRRIPEPQIKVLATSQPVESQKGQIYHRAM